MKRINRIYKGVAVWIETYGLSTHWDVKYMIVEIKEDF